MTKKDELIIYILRKELKGIKKLMDESQSDLDSIRKNGFDKEIHHGNHYDILTGLAHTIGYCTCKIHDTKGIISMLKKGDYRDIETLIEHNKEIEKKNKKMLDELFDKVKLKLKKPRKKRVRILKSHPLAKKSVMKKVEKAMLELKKEKANK